VKTTPSAEIASPPLERQPPPVALDVKADNLAVDELGFGPLGDLA
jgi:hypothetical protein